MMPRFIHDCERPGCCCFVGSTALSDVYFYRSIAGIGVILRRSDEGSDYLSFPGMKYLRHYAAMTLQKGGDDYFNKSDSDVFEAIDLITKEMA